MVDSGVAYLGLAGDVFAADGVHRVVAQGGEYVPGAHLAAVVVAA